MTSIELQDGLHVVLGAGPVGWAVATELAAGGADVRVVTRSGSGPEAGRIERVAADLRDRAAAVAACRDAAVVYGAAQPAYHRWPQEFPALQDAMLAGAEAAGAVFAAVENLYGYGPVDGAMNEDLPLVATTRKGRVRAAMSDSLFAAHRAGRVRTVAGRASDYFGPRAEGSAVGDRFFPPLLAGRTVAVVGDPDTRHTFTFVDDLARALVLLANTESAWGRPWHVPNAPTVTIRAFTDLARSLAGTSGRLSVTPRWALRLVGLAVPGARETVEMLYEFEHDFVVDDRSFVETFGMTATPLVESLATTIEWWRHRSG